MKRTILFGALVVSSFFSIAQDPVLTSWQFNTNGLATYDVGSGTVTMSDSSDVLRICYDNNNVYVVAEGLASYEMGPFPMNPNTPAGQDFVWRIKRNPAPETGTHTDEPVTGPFGVAVNGVALYGKGDARSYDPSTNSNSAMGLGIWNSDAWVSEGATMDANGNGHPQQMGQYHYHANPSALYDDPSTAHSPIIGWALDGYPIYGPFGYTDPLDSNSAIKRMECGYALRSITTRNTLPNGSTSTPPGPNVNATFPIGTYWEDYEFLGTGDLDEYNGRTCITPEYPSGTYAYFLSTETNGDPKFPYMIGLQYYGQVSTSEINTGANANIPGSATCTTDPIGIGISEEANVLNSLYPNPADQSVIVDLEVGTYNIIFTDLMGKQVLQHSTNITHNNISTIGLSNGTYVVSVYDDSGVLLGTKRLVIAR